MLNLSTESLSSLPQAKRTELEQLVEVAKYRWSLHARPSQLIPGGDWTTWLIKAGRGWGKTRVAAETIRTWKETNPIIHFIGATSADVRDVMVEGISGILNVSPPWDKPKYESSKRRVVWKNGAYALLFSSEEPDRLRGPQCYAAWCDEFASWKYAQDTWDNMSMGLRLGNHPRVIATTTPRPIKVIKDLMKDPSTYITSGSTYENLSNLAPAFMNTIIKKYEGTRLGRQELMAEVLEDVEGALWNIGLIDQWRVKEAPPLVRLGVAIDPAVTSNKESDETGIIVGGKSVDGNIYILSDKSGIYTPQGWASIAIGEYDKWKANWIIGEANNGGDLIETVLRNIDRSITYQKVTASRGKFTRAEPVVALYEQGRVHHVGSLPKLEDQMINWSPVTGERSPDRIDAMVWLVSHLMNEKGNSDFWVV